MDQFFDEAARMLASRMPRRQVIRLLGRSLAGGIVAAFGVARVNAASCTISPNSCGSGQKCCPGFNGGNNFCASSTDICCGKNHCPSNQFCCPATPGTSPFCRTASKICCGNTACKANQACISGRCGASSA